MKKSNEKAGHTFAPLNISLIGGIDRLRKHYIAEAKKAGVDLRVFSKTEVNITAKIQNADAMVIFTNKISHEAKKAAMQVARTHDIPVLMSHSCGVCTLRQCIDCLVNKSLSAAAL
jgi:hypothetical protein